MKKPTDEEIIRSVKSSIAIEGVKSDLLPFKMHTATPQEKWRARTFWEKEPETLEWIRCFSPNSVFWDVGANVGVYSLFAASLGHRVMAFEPQLANWVGLTNNIALNGWQGRVKAILCGIGNRQGFEKFATDKMDTGGSGGQMGGAGKVSYDIPVYSLDYLAIWGWPNHIKIDIDGLEEKVVDGMRFLIRWGIKSCLIELPKFGPVRDRIASAFTDQGYTDQNHFNRIENHSRTKPWRVNSDIENVVFTKKR